MTLTSNEPGETWFRALGGGVITSGGNNSGDFQLYTGALSLTLDKNGEVVLRYYSVDALGNVEAWREEILQ